MLKSCLCAFVTFCISIHSPCVHSAQWYVNPAATAEADGSESRPYSSLTEARDAIRKHRAARTVPEPDTVWLESGAYELTETFELDAEDGGSELAPVHWKAVTPGTAKISGNELSTLVAIYDAQHLTLAGWTLTGATDQAVEVAHCAHVVIQDCHVSNIEHTGLHLFGGSDCELRSCKVHQCGSHGIRVEAGDRMTLTSARHRVTDCELWNCADDGSPMAAAIHLSGVGSIVQNNHVHDCNGCAIRIDGNDHEVSTNRLQHVCLSTHDVGAIYLGHDVTERGNLIEQNIISDVGTESQLDAIAIYLDDFASGTRVRGNYIARAGRGIAIGGGDDNLVEVNYIEDCAVGIQLDSRGADWLSSAFVPDSGFVHQAWMELADSHASYLLKYPELQRLSFEATHAASGNRVEANLLQRCGKIAVDSKTTVSQNQMVRNSFGHELFVFDGDRMITITHNEKSPKSAAPAQAIALFP